MPGLGRGYVRAVAAALGAAALGAAPAAAGAGTIAACSADRPFATAEALGARDGATIRLRNGREVRLAGIVAPGGLDGDEEAERAATAALDALVAGRSISLHGDGGTQDRYGRLVAQVAIAGDARRWVQAALVEAGAVRAAPGAGDPDCAAALLAAERTPREARQGLWSRPGFAVMEADAVEPLLAMVGRFAVVEGVVRRVGEVGGRLLLDFGRRFTEDFTLVIPREAQAAFAAAGVDLRALSGKAVRARGVLHAWGGPALVLRVPAALEVMGADGA